MTDLARPKRARPRVAWRLHREFVERHRIAGHVALQRIPSGDDDACYAAVRDGATTVEPQVFLRTWPGDVTRSELERWRRLTALRGEGVEEVFNVGRRDGHAYVTSTLFAGHSLDLVAQHVRPSWSVAIALLHDALHRLAVANILRELPVIAPARFVCTTGETLALTHGRRAGSNDWRTAVEATARMAMHLAATTEERELLAAIDDISVACDAFVERHPELDPALPAVLADGIASTPLVAELVSEHELVAFWDAVRAIP